MKMIWVRMVFGLIGGIVATGPMTIAMIKLHRKLPKDERHPLPPREITTKLTHLLGIGHRLDHTDRSALALLNHFAYGSACGGVYGAAIEPLPGPPVAKGLLYSLAVWAISYLGILPGLHILKSAARQPGRRNLVMIGAHLVWGITLAKFLDAMLRESGRNEGALTGHSGHPHHDAR